MAAGGPQLSYGMAAGSRGPQGGPPPRPQGAPPPSYGMAAAPGGGSPPSYGMDARSRGTLRGNLARPQGAPPSSYGKAESFSMSKESSMKKSKAKKSTGQGLFSGIGSALQSSS